MKKILLLGSDELGEEFVISTQHKGQYIIACDPYAEVPAVQVVDKCEVFSMLDGDVLERVVHEHKPDVIVLEIGATRTERLCDFEKEGIQIVPSARTVNFIMNRKAVRDLAAKELGLKTVKYFYARLLDELKTAAEKIGFSYMMKSLMLSLGKGQSLVRSADELEYAWEYGYNGSRGGIKELITERLIKLGSEVTLLTITQENGSILFCPPIGHVQKGGGYHESFQPTHIDLTHLKEVQEMAEKMTRALTGAGLWGVELSLSHENGVYFFEFFPRPYNTGMVTLVGIQNLNEFELHCRAVLGLSIPNIKQEQMGANAVILSTTISQGRPNYRDMREIVKEEDTYLRIFGKPTARINRRMGVVLYCAPLDSGLDALRDKAKRIARKVEVY